MRGQFHAKSASDPADQEFSKLSSLSGVWTENLLESRYKRSQAGPRGLRIGLFVVRKEGLDGWQSLGKAAEREGSA